MHYPKDVIDEIRMGNDIVDVIGSYVKLTKRGSSHVGLCPFHKEKTPSFSVNHDKQFFKCFGCGESGNVITFLMKYENFSFEDTIKELASRINYKLPEQSYSKEQIIKKEFKQKLYDIHKIAARFYYDKLISPEGKAAADYLDKRQIKSSTRTKFGLGYSPIARGALYNKLKDDGFDDDIIFKSGLCYKKENGSVYDKFYNRLMFPIINVFGNVIGFGGRVMGDGNPKYLNSAESEIFIKSNNLYNLNLARKSKVNELILVEGYMDAITIYQAGFHNVVASLGTAFNERHAKVIKNYANSVILLFDSDQAGTNAILKAIPILRSAGLKVRVVQVTDAKDPDEYIKRFGSVAFGEILRKAKSHIIFEAEQIQKKYDLDILEEKISFTNEIAKLLKNTDNTIEADAYLKEVARITQIDIASIRSEIDSLNNSADDSVLIHKFTQSKHKDGYEEAKRGLITLLVANKSLYNHYKNILKPEHLEDKTYEKVLNIIYKLYDEDKNAVPADIVSCFETAEEQTKVSKIFIEETVYSPQTTEKAFNDQLKTVLKLYYTNKLIKETDHKKINNISQKLKEVNNLHISLVKG